LSVPVNFTSTLSATYRNINHQSFQLGRSHVYDRWVVLSQRQGFSKVLTQADEGACKDHLIEQHAQKITDSQQKRVFLARTTRAKGDFPPASGHRSAFGLKGLTPMFSSEHP
jgi:hypothetical protein